tara:strand:- start:1207 stop:1854 length:648 start_codon:yes stop_codon:yes gene_type:complete
MPGQIPQSPKLFHILHHNKLGTVINSGGLFSDAILAANNPNGTIIGMNKIKRRRLTELRLSNYPDLYVGQCVPFYFCPRSVMLYMFWQDNHDEIDYHGGQEPIIHLQFDMHRIIAWANQYNVRWAFTSSNAGSRWFQDYNDLRFLNRINWDVIKANMWRGYKEEKQAEFLLQNSIPWQLVEHIGVYSAQYDRIVNQILNGAEYKPSISVHRDWYY